jgi:hypothetical protein
MSLRAEQSNLEIATAAAQPHDDKHEIFGRGMTIYDHWPVCFGRRKDMLCYLSKNFDVVEEVDRSGKMWHNKRLIFTNR